MSVGACLCILLLVFVIVFFVIVPLSMNGTEQVTMIWTPWCRPGSCGHWTPEMQRCLQNMIQNMKPPNQRHTQDPDLVRKTMNENDFYSFLDTFISPQT